MPQNISKKLMKHTHTHDIIKIDEFGQYYSWMCSCGKAGGSQAIKEGQLEALLKSNDAR